MHDESLVRRPDKVGQPVAEKNEVLRHFEYAVLSAVSQLGEKAFPAEITRRLNALLQRHVSLAQVFVALERLEDKGLVRSSVLWPEPVRGGRRRRVFQMEASGVRAIRNTAAVFNRVSSSGQLEDSDDQYATS
jgi:PadR family transcriptional regulator, regulatory protein PadR